MALGCSPDNCRTPYGKAIALWQLLSTSALYAHHQKDIIHEIRDQCIPQSLTTVTSAQDGDRKKLE